MNGRIVLLVQALRGPVLLATLGALLLVDHLTQISFWRIWPVLVIVFGVFKLVETILRRPAEGLPR